MPDRVLGVTAAMLLATVAAGLFPGAAVYVTAVDPIRR
jgi:hypothetical protein